MLRWPKKPSFLKFLMILALINALLNISNGQVAFGFMKGCGWF
jgi:hypothetical protein